MTAASELAELRAQQIAFEPALRAAHEIADMYRITAQHEIEQTTLARQERDALLLRVAALERMAKRLGGCVCDYCVASERGEVHER